MENGNMGIGIIILFFLILMIVIPLDIYGSVGATYKVSFGNLTPEQCQHASTSVRDIEFKKVTLGTDPCTLEPTYYYHYKVTWKANAEGWLLSHLGKEGIAIESIETSNIFDEGD